MTRAAVFILATLVLSAPAFADAPKLGLPITCEVGKTCWVQQYADHDASTGVQDYACGSETYDGHDGTDGDEEQVPAPELRVGDRVWFRPAKAGEPWERFAELHLVRDLGQQ